ASSSSVAPRQTMMDYLKSQGSATASSQPELYKVITQPKATTTSSSSSSSPTASSSAAPAAPAADSSTDAQAAAVHPFVLHSMARLAVQNMQRYQQDIREASESEVG